MQSAVSEVTSGVQILIRGIGLVLRRPRLALLGMVPPLFVSALMITLIALLGFFGLGPLTDFATGWVPEALRMAARILIGVVIMAVAILVAVVLFVSLTLALGSPVYERISIAVEREIRGAELPSSEPVLTGILRAARQSLAVVALSAVAAVMLFLVGLIPAVGAVLSLALGAITGGYFLVVEMISGPFDRWGMRRLGQKVDAVNANRGKALGFGVPVFLIFSIPMLSVIMFPAATAGATLLAHDLTS